MAIIKVITPSVTDANITTAKVIDNAITLAKMASGTDGNIISYDASGNPVAIATGNDGQVLTSTGAGSPPVFETPVSGVNTPAFYAFYGGSGVSINDATTTKLTFPTEFFDVGGVYNNSTYRYTPGFIGKSYISVGVGFYDPSGDLQDVILYIYKNGSQLTGMKDNPSSNAAQVWQTHNIIADHDADDYYEIYARADTSDGGAIEVPVTSGGTSTSWNYFYGFKLIT